jgi:hypothetical protein
MTNRIYFVHFLLLSFAACSVAVAQNTTDGPVGVTGGMSSVAKASHLKLGTLPPDVRLYADAVGSRLTASGLEQTTIAGTYKDANGSVPLTLVWQNPGKVQVTLGTSVLTYAGAAAGVTGARSAAYDDLLETLTDDYPDAFFFNVGASGYRFLGAMYRMDGGKAPVYTGPYYDICEKVGTVPSKKSVNQKFYFFDSTTHLLHLVRYQDGAGPSAPQVAVEFSDWKRINGQETPGTITRIVNGVTEFTLSLGNPILAAAGSNSVFTTP